MSWGLECSTLQSCTLSVPARQVSFLLRFHVFGMWYTVYWYFFEELQGFGVCLPFSKSHKFSFRQAPESEILTASAEQSGSRFTDA